MPSRSLLSILETAVAYAAAGLPVIPLLGPLEGTAHTAGKQPRMRGWQHEILTVDQVRQWWGRCPASNLGLVTGARSGLDCIDIDPRNGGTPWFQEYRDGFRHLGAGFERTGSGGWHIWFVTPRGVRVRSRRGVDGLAPGVELLADGGHQAVIAPSVHRTGGAYAWFDGPQLPDLRDFGPVLPDWIVQLAGVQPERANDHPVGDRAAEVYLDVLDDIERCAAALETLEGATEGAGGDLATFEACCLGRDYAVSHEAFWPLLLEWNARCAPPWEEDALREKMANAYTYAKAEAPGQASPSATFAAVPLPAVPVPQEPRPASMQGTSAMDGFSAWEDGLVRTSKGRWENCPRNLQLALTHDERLNQCFRYNLFSEAVELVRPPWRGWVASAEWSDDDAAALVAWLTHAYPAKPCFTVSIVHQIVRPFAKMHAYHPVHDYLDSLRWDGVPRLATWLIDRCGATDIPYHRAVGRRFLVGAVARVRKPGCQMDTCLILEGKQGIGKSRAARVLFDPLATDDARWFTDAMIDIMNKDASQTIRGHWGVELGEMHTLRRAEQTAIKSYFSRRADRQRDVYDHCTATHPRQCVFIGTTNSKFNQNDDTGGRRFWPVECRRVDVEALTAERGQLWAEAQHAFDAGEQWHLTAEEEGWAEEQWQLRHLPDPWLETIKAHVLDADFGVSRGQGITGLEIFTGVLGGPALHVKRADFIRIAECMHALGFEHKVFWRNGKSVRGFIREGQ